ncbi:MAG: ChaN family lipoprotein [Phycisphaerae bacterium]|nr:ChaN family lipoprotein [Gemmatimonadaceae bacterium]
MQHTRPATLRRVIVQSFGVGALFAGATVALAVSAHNAMAQAPMRAATPATTRANAVASTSYVPHRVYDSRKKRWIDFETLMQRANGMDLVFVGELHNDTPGHVMELAILEGIARRRGAEGGPVVVSLEMFERDVQGEVDKYLSGEIDEATFLSRSRPWPNYGADYRPLVEIARANKWPVVASNVPRPLAAMVNRGGLTALDTLNATARAQHVATDISCPRDQYYKNFAGLMGDMSGHGAPAASAAISKDSANALAASAAAAVFRMYQAQCIKDETMGESIARALATARTRAPGATVVHMNGSFHTDYALGTAERAKKRSDSANSMVITIVPTPNLDDVDAKALRKKADYLVFTVGKPQ